MSPGAPAADSLRTVLDSVFAGPAYRWVERPDPFAYLARWWGMLQRWLDGVRSGHPGLFQLLLWALIAVLVAVLVHGGWVMAQTVRAARAPDAGPGPPLPEARSAAWYRRQAGQLAATGQYPEAMHAEFLALALDLDQRRLLRFHPSKTPSEYSHEARMNAASQEAFRGLVGALYGYAFARIPCGADDFAAWRQAALAEHYAGAD